MEQGKGLLQDSGCMCHGFYCSMVLTQHVQRCQMTAWSMTSRRHIGSKVCYFIQTRCIVFTHTLWQAVDAMHARLDKEKFKLVSEVYNVLLDAQKCVQCMSRALAAAGQLKLCAGMTQGRTTRAGWAWLGCHTESPY